MWFIKAKWNKIFDVLCTKIFIEYVSELLCVLSLKKVEWVGRGDNPVVLGKKIHDQF